MSSETTRTHYVVPGEKEVARLGQIYIGYPTEQLEAMYNDPNYSSDAKRAAESILAARCGLERVEELKSRRSQLEQTLQDQAL